MDEHHLGLVNEHIIRDHYLAPASRKGNSKVHAVPKVKEQYSALGQCVQSSGLESFFVAAMLGVFIM